MTCRSPRKEDSAFLPATAVVSVLRKPGSTKIFAAVVFAAVAIAITITASGLWDDSTLAAIFDNPAAPATVIPNVSDVWSITLDAVDSIMSSEWLIPPAFAATTIKDLGNQTVTEGAEVTISAIITYDGPDFSLFWYQTDPYDPDLGLHAFDNQTSITFTAPLVKKNTDFSITIVVDGDEQVTSAMTLTILDSISTPPADAFVTTWRTTFADQSITINFVGSGMNVTWGDDGMTETNLLGPQTHTYEDAGNYTVSVTGGLTGLTLDRPLDFGLPGPVPELASIDQWGGISWTNMSNAFAGASNMTYSATDTPDLSLVTDMSYMFEGATAFDGDLSFWNVSSVTSMSSMFEGATAFDQNLGNWYVVLNSTSIVRSDVPGVVGSISAQNKDLDGHSPVYNVTGSDSTRFAIVNGNQLNMTSVDDTKSDYTVNVTASGGSVFEDGNNWRLLKIDVTGQTTDTTPPVIELDGPATITITVGGTYNEQGAVCDDDVDLDKPATVGGQTVDVDAVGTYIITYDCTDTSNNAATQVTRTVTVTTAADNTSPVIELDGPATITITVGGTYNEQGAVCDDDVDLDKPATVGGQTVDVDAVGTYIITYDCTDTSNNAATQVTRTVTVEAAIDTTAPVIELDGPATITITVGGTYNEQGAVCDDDVDLDKPATVGGQTVDVDAVGTYIITYDCTDTSNNAATQVTRTVTVTTAADNTSPVIELDGPATITITVGGTYNEQGAVCDDDVDLDKPATVGGQTVDVDAVGTYIITYDCTDTSNNAATQVTRTVTVEAAIDTTAPVIELDGPATITITVGGTYNEQGAVCDDDVDLDKPATVGGQTVDVDAVGTYIITYDCTDTSNNAATQVTRTVTVEAAIDTTAPVIELDGPATITITVGGTYNEQGAVCDDDVDLDKPATVGGQTVDVDAVGTYIITYDCTDTSNNAATQVTRTVTVEAAIDTTAPVIELDGPATITITVGGTYNEQGAVCDDDVDLDKPATVGGQTVDVDAVNLHHNLRLHGHLKQCCNTGDKDGNSDYSS